MLDRIPQTFESLVASGNADCSEQTPRAERFDLQLRLRYHVVEQTPREGSSIADFPTPSGQVPVRASPEGAWEEGRTQNISRTGVLFRAERLLEVGTPVEMDIELSEGNGGEAAARLVCQAEIVRIADLPTTSGPVPVCGSSACPGLAAKFLEYRFVHGSPVEM